MIMNSNHDDKSIDHSDFDRISKETIRDEQQQQMTFVLVVVVEF